MKSVLLDTHVALWVFERAPFLSQRVIAILNDPEVVTFVSPISAYELALKASVGKLNRLPRPFEELASLASFSILAITMEQCELAGRLPLTSRDPWDRLLSAQSILAPMPLLSRDTKISALGAEVIWY